MRHTSFCAFCWQCWGFILFKLVAFQAKTLMTELCNLYELLCGIYQKFISRVCRVNTESSFHFQMTWRRSRRCSPRCWRKIPWSTSTTRPSTAYRWWWWWWHVCNSMTNWNIYSHPSNDQCSTIFPFTKYIWTVSPPGNRQPSHWGALQLFAVQGGRLGEFSSLKFLPPELYSMSCFLVCTAITINVADLYSAVLGCARMYWLGFSYSHSISAVDCQSFLN